MEIFEQDVHFGYSFISINVRQLLYNYWSIKYYIYVEWTNVVNSAINSPFKVRFHSKFLKLLIFGIM